MLYAKSGAAPYGYGNGHSSKNTKKPASKSSVGKKTTSYFDALRQRIIAQYRGEPLTLSQTKAEKCADEIMKIVRRNHREAERFSLP